MAPDRVTLATRAGPSDWSEGRLRARFTRALAPRQRCFRVAIKANRFGVDGQGYFRFL
jgi:hypothetical protein